MAISYRHLRASENLPFADLLGEGQWDGLQDGPGSSSYGLRLDDVESLLGKWSRDGPGGSSRGLIAYVDERRLGEWSWEGTSYPSIIPRSSSGSDAAYLFASVFFIRNVLALKFCWLIFDFFLCNLWSLGVNLFIISSFLPLFFEHTVLFLFLGILYTA